MSAVIIRSLLLLLSILSSGCSTLRAGSRHPWAPLHPWVSRLGNTAWCVHGAEFWLMDIRWVLYWLLFIL